MESGPWWRLGRFGRPEGPFSASEMRDALRRGRVRVTDPVWSPGAGDWAPFDTAFPYEPGSAPRPPIAALVLTVLALALSLAFALAGAFGELFIESETLPRLADLPGISIGLALATAAIVAAAVRYARRSRTMLRRRPRARTALRVASVAILVVGLVVTVLHALQVAATYVLSAEMGHDSYTLTRAFEPDRLVIVGDVGLGFGNAVADAIRNLPDPIRIEIDSEGGLALEAMRAARAIEKRPGAIVVARHECDSACTIVLMAGSRRLADRNMKIGFHAISGVAAEGKRMTLFGFDPNVALGGLLGDDYLVQRGVPPDIVAQANRIGEDDMVMVEAQVLRDRGALHDLVEPLPRAESERDSN